MTTTLLAAAAALVAAAAVAAEAAAAAAAVVAAAVAAASAQAAAAAAAASINCRSVGVESCGAKQCARAEGKDGPDVERFAALSSALCAEARRDSPAATVLMRPLTTATPSAVPHRLVMRAMSASGSI